MLRRSIAFSLGCFLLAACTMAAGAPQRIVSLAPSFTEILFAVGAGNRVVGTTSFCDYPPEALKTAKIGDLLNPNLEEIIALHPDLVILGAWKWQVPEKLRSVGIPVAEIKDAQNIEDVLNRILTIGETVGKKEKAKEIVASMHRDLDRFHDRSRKLVRRATVFIELDTGNWTVGSGSYLTEILEMAGLQNIFADRKEPYLMVTAESIASRDPDLILSLDRTTMDYRNSPDFQSLRAVRDGKILDKPSFNWDEITRQSPRMIQGIQKLIDSTNRLVK
jgi:iron complex transport system substrate-binding protein